MSIQYVTQVAIWTFFCESGRVFLEFSRSFLIFANEQTNTHKT